MTANHRALDDSDIALIDRVKLTATLYDPRNPDFRLAYRKEQEWENVASCLGISAVDARRRWTCLRDRYSRELKQLRLHPMKGEFGKNEFFRSMDFLRKFVRKRRERRRNAMFKYDSSWEGSMDDKKFVAKKMDVSVVDDGDEEEQNSYEEDQENFSEKLEVATTETMEYPEFVEVDTSETYEDYVEHQPTASPNSSQTNKAISSTLIPLMLSQPGDTYALTSTPSLQQFQSPPKQFQPVPEPANETEDDFFCKSIAAYLRQLSRRHKIKAKVEMFQILEKYIELEENSESSSTFKKD